MNVREVWLKLLSFRNKSSTSTTMNRDLEWNPDDDELMNVEEVHTDDKRSDINDKDYEEQEESNDSCGNSDDTEGIVADEKLLIPTKNNTISQKCTTPKSTSSTNSQTRDRPAKNMATKHKSTSPVTLLGEMDRRKEISQKTHASLTKSTTPVGYFERMILQNSYEL